MGGLCGGDQGSSDLKSPRVDKNNKQKSDAADERREQEASQQGQEQAGVRPQRAPSKQANVESKSAADDDDQKQPALPLPGEQLEGIQFDLEKDLKLLQKKFSGKYEPLLERNKIQVKCDAIDDSYDVAANSIKVLQFNMLADGLSTAYISGITEKTFLGVEKTALQWPYRGVRLVEEILRFEPDVIALEECDKLEFIMKYLTPKGYMSQFSEKKGSPIKHAAAEIAEDHGIAKDSVKLPNDGVALIYKTDKFELCGEAQIVDPKQNEKKILGLGVPLRIKNIDQEVFFVVTHLKSTKSQEGEELRRDQITILLNDLLKNERNLPVLLLCDLNANPVENKKGYAPLCYNAITDEKGLAYKSAHVLANGQEPSYTTYKLRQHGTDKHVLDYIFIKDGQWNVTQLLSIPTPSDKDQSSLIPNWHYPSDHFSIFAQLTWK